MRKILVVMMLAVIGASAFGQDIALPEPKLRAGVDLLEAMNARNGGRTFVRRELPMADLSTILWAGNGLRRNVDAVSSASRMPPRTIPYSGDIVYMNVYVLNEKGVYAYVAEKNLLRQVSTGDQRPAVVGRLLPHSVCTVLFTTDGAKTPGYMKGGPVREMMNGTAGFAAQNIALAASAMGMDSLVMYGFKADALRAAAKLGTEEQPLFLMQLGYRK